MIVYPLFIWAIAQAAPAKGKGETVEVNNKVVGYKLEGQLFTSDNYFQGRPSAAGYNAAGSSGSNKGPSNPGYLQMIKDRVDSFLVHNPGVKKEQVPSDLVTASGSGLDPHISPAAAIIQIARVAKTRGIAVDKIKILVNNHIEQPLAGLAGTSRVNVLLLNIDLDKLK